MIAVKVCLKVTQEPLKRTPVVLRLDSNDFETEPVLTDCAGIASFEQPPNSGRVMVSGVERYHGRLDGEIRIDIWSMTQPGDDSRGMPGDFPTGSNAYPAMSTRHEHPQVQAGNLEVLTDSEGYLVDPSTWSEAFARSEAALEGLRLGVEHWEVIRFLREHYAKHGTQVSVRDMIRHYCQVWGADRGSIRYLPQLFPMGGPQKQGNRLAGLLRTKGEH